MKLAWAARLGSRINQLKLIWTAAFDRRTSKLKLVLTVEMHCRTGQLKLVWTVKLDSKRSAGVGLDSSVGQRKIELPMQIDGRSKML